MANTVQFDVDDTSPTITYFPFADTFSTPELRSGWNPYFTVTGFATSLGETGVGTSFHITSLYGATLSLSWHGTGIQLIGNATQASYTIILDDIPTPPNSTDLVNNILAQFEGLTNTNHTIILRASTTMTESTNSFIAFEKASITAPPPNSTPSNSTFATQVLDDTGIQFFGQWTTTNGSAESNSSHQSNTAGDLATSNFTGTTLLLIGTTSPTSGQYSVTLDNITTNHTGRSSFTKLDSLLFFASGLDIQITHNVQVVNTDGSLLELQAGGFQVISMNPSPRASSPSAPTPSSSLPAVHGAMYSKGAILAFVLAGILAFALTVGFLFFCFVYRPRARRRRLIRLEMRRKNQDAGEMVDIRPDLGTTADTGNGERTGLTRWKNEVGGGFGGLRLGALGEALKRSGPTKGKEKAHNGGNAHGVSNKPLNIEFSVLSISSSQRGRENGNGLETTRTPSETTSFNIDLPSLPSDSRPNTASQPNTVSLLTTRPIVDLSQTPHPPSPSTFPRDSSIHHSSPNPSLNYSAIPPSGSRSQPRSSRLISSNTRTRSDSQRLLLPYGNPDLSSPDGDYEPPPALLPSDSLQSRVSSGGDQVSYRKGSEEAAGILGPASTQAALRSLSPRISQSRRSLEGRSSARTSFYGRESKQWPKAVLPTIKSESSSDTDKEASLRRQQKLEGPQAGLQQDTDGDRQQSHGDRQFLNVRATSPFRVDFGESSLGCTAPVRVSRHSAASHVRFEDDIAEETEDKHDLKKSGEQEVDEGQNAAQKRRKEVSQSAQSTFRLTPLSFQVAASQVEGSDVGAISSFLDFSSSSEASSRQRSSHTSSSSQGNQVPVPPPLPGDSSDTNISPRQSLPRSVSLPSRGSVPSFQDQTNHSLPRPSVITEQPPSLPLLHVPNNVDIQSLLDTHPAGLTSMQTSPTDSITMTVSDIQFRNSTDASGLGSRPSTGSLRLSQPQPTRSVDDQENTPALAAFSTPTSIVQRVLGTHTPTPSGPGHHPSHSTSASLSTPRAQHEYYASTSASSSPGYMYSRFNQ